MRIPPDAPPPRPYREMAPKKYIRRCDYFTLPERITSCLATAESVGLLRKRPWPDNLQRNLPKRRATTGRGLPSFVGRPVCVRRISLPVHSSPFAQTLQPSDDWPLLEAPGGTASSMCMTLLFFALL